MAWVLSRALIYKSPGTKRVRAQSFDFFYLHRNTFLFASVYFFICIPILFYLHRNTFFICIAILFYLQRFFFICSVSFLFAVCPLWAIVDLHGKQVNKLMRVGK